MPPATPANAALLEEAADWIMQLRFGTPGEQQRQDFERWRAQSAAHREAWARAEAVLGTFDQLPAGVGKPALRRLEGMGRRRALRMLAVMLAAAPAALLVSNTPAWQEWLADAATGTGQRKTLTLADGTRVVLNTASAIDIVFDARQRLLVLRAGEILVSTGKDPSATYRPFLVQTSEGTVQALGTRFSVRRLDGETRVAVFEEKVEIRPLDAAARRLSAGQQADFSTTAIGPVTPVDAGAALWEHGMLVARDMRLADVLAEMARYRRGVLRCHPAVAQLRVSGAISLEDTDAGLALLVRTLPLRVTSYSRYWVHVGPAG